MESKTMLLGLKFQRGLQHADSKDLRVSTHTRQTCACGFSPVVHFPFAFSLHQSRALRDWMCLDFNQWTTTVLSQIFIRVSSNQLTC
jgi:hypothetical protein